MTSERPDDVGWLKGGKGEDISLTEELKLFAEYIKVKEQLMCPFTSDIYHTPYIHSMFDLVG